MELTSAEILDQSGDENDMRGVAAKPTIAGG
jgi:hypothetical protein